MSARTIVHLAPFLQGGAGRAIASLVRAQCAAGDDVLVVTSRTPEPGFENYPEYLAAITAAGAGLVQVDSLFKRDPRLHEAAIRTTRTALGRRCPAIIHAHAAVAAGLGSSLASGRCPVIQTMHGWSLNKAASYARDDLAVMRTVDLVVFPSRAARDALLAIGGQFRATIVIPYGLPRRRDDWEPLPEGLADLRKRHERGARVILTIGSLTRQKNHAVVVAALPRLLASHDVVAVLVGEGPEIAVLREQAAALGVGNRVYFTGYLPAAARVLQVADVLVQPSLTESFGLAVVEAFRAGVPVVVSDIPALVDLIDGGHAGWAFPPQEPAGLAHAVDAVLASSTAMRRAVTDAARRLFEERFTEDAMTGGYARLYDSV